MRMQTPFKYLLGVAALPLLLASCSKDELDMDAAQPDAARYITFGAPGFTVETDMTRAATDGFLDAFPEGGSFGVLGYCLPRSPMNNSVIQYQSGSAVWGSKNNNAVPDVLCKRKVTYQNGTCTYTDPRRWYTDGDAQGQVEGAQTGDVMTGTDDYSYTFFAYYPYDGESAGTGGPAADSGYEPFTFEKPKAENEATVNAATDMGAPIMSFHMPFTAYSGSGTEESTYNTSLNPDKVPDPLVAYRPNVTRSDGRVQFAFSHVLTGLGFRVNNYSQTSEEGGTAGETITGQDLYIYSIKLKGSFYRSVRMDFSNAGMNVSYTADDYYRGTYTLYEATGDEATTGHKVTYDATDGENTFAPTRYLRLLSGNGTLGYFGPVTRLDEKDNTVSDVVIEIRYKFGDDEEIQTRSFNRPGTFTPRSGMRYTAQLNWVGNAFVVVVTPDNGDNWNDGIPGGGAEFN